MKPSKRRRRRARSVAGSPSGVQLGEGKARMRILAGAAHVFASRGIRDASVAAILDAASVSRRTFYRLYQSKEDVVAALYRLGTERMLDDCRAAIREEPERTRRIDRCIDAHLRNARDLDRLMFVLGGEAQRQESPIHAARAEIHAQLATLFASRAGTDDARVSHWLRRGVVLALEGVTRFALEEGDEGRNVTDESLERARRVMRRVATTAFAEGIEFVRSA